MSRSKSQDYSNWTVQQLIEYGVGCADALKHTSKPADRKRLHASIACVMQALAPKLLRHPSYVYTQRPA